MTHEKKPESTALPGLAYFSELITLKRGARSLRDVAPEIGVSVATISRIESGKTPDLITFAALCRWLEMSPDVFLARYEPGKPPVRIEQKPESAEFQTREAQIETMTVHYMEAGFPINAARRLARDGVAEAEARGAAEREAQDIEEAKDEGANYVLTSLALLFGRDGFEIQEGSETWEGDVNATLEGILKAGGLIDEEGDLLDLATLKDRLAEKRQKDVEGVEPFIIVDALYKPGVSALYSHTANAAEAEKQEPFGYFPKRLVGRNWSGATIKRECSPQSEPKIPLYTRPANFAALEDRVKELEGKLCSQRDRYAALCLEMAQAEALFARIKEGNIHMKEQVDALVTQMAAFREGGDHG